MNVTAHTAAAKNVAARSVGAPAGGSNAPARNPGMALDLGWLEEMRAVNKSALERRVATLTKRRSVKGEAQAAWLLKAIACMDLTSLNSNDTDERIRRLCAKAKNPLRPDIAEGLGLSEPIRPAAVCGIL